MPFLTLGGVDFPVIVGSATEEEPERIGTHRLRMFDGSLRTTVRAEYRNAGCTVGPLTDAELATLRATIAPPIIDVAGSWLGAMRANVSIEEVTPDEFHGPGGVISLVHEARISITEAAAGQ
jgi:hypothetical protein